MNQNICLRCGHIFNNKSNLNRHYQKISPCPNTYYNYTSQYMFKNHIKLQAMRVELIVYINKDKQPTSTKIKIKSESPSQIIYKQLKSKLKQLDDTNTNNTVNLTNKYNKYIQYNQYKEYKEYKCDCGKIFSHHSSLSRHKQTKHKKIETLLSKLLKNRKN